MLHRLLTKAESATLGLAAIVGRAANRTAPPQTTPHRPSDPVRPRMFMGLRDFGPWWAELYRTPGEPVSFLVRLLAGHGDRPDFKRVRLELGDHTAVAVSATGSCLSARLPAGSSLLGELRLVAECPDGTVLTALWD